MNIKKKEMTRSRSTAGAPFIIWRYFNKCLTNIFYEKRIRERYALKAELFKDLMRCASILSALADGFGALFWFADALQSAAIALRIVLQHPY